MYRRGKISRTVNRYFYCNHFQNKVEKMSINYNGSLVQSINSKMYFHRTGYKKIINTKELFPLL